MGSIELNAPDLGNTTSLYDLKDFTLLLPPGITLSTIGHFAKAVVGADGKVINLCDHVVYTVEKRYSVRIVIVVYTVEKRYSVRIVIVVYNCLYKFLTFSKKRELFVAHFKPKLEPAV